MMMPKDYHLKFKNSTHASLHITIDHFLCESKQIINTDIIDVQYNRKLFINLITVIHVKIRSSRSNHCIHFDLLLFFLGLMRKCIIKLVEESLFYREFLESNENDRTCPPMELSTLFFSTRDFL